MRYRLLLVGLLTVFVAHAQAPADYYNLAANKKGYALRSALHYIIKNHTSLSYSDLWEAFYTTDRRTDNGKVWDIYSDNPGGNTAYYFTFGDDKCGSYSSEGDCYNREHSIPKSWFGDAAPMYTDLFHLYPTDGFVNGKRGNLPLGEVSNASWTSTNGSKLGNCSVPGYSNTVFEPNDAYKGDLARSCFYFTVCYMDKNLGQESMSMFSGGSLKPWALEMLIRWHNEDPVSQKEIDRNNAVYAIQHNRNPFIDYPELVGKIFGSDSVNAFNPTGIEDWNLSAQCRIYPNPARDNITVEFPMETSEAVLQIFNMAGQLLMQQNCSVENIQHIDVSSILPGMYILRIQTDKYHIHKKIIISH